jgi:hypothetical protein
VLQIAPTTKHAFATNYLRAHKSGGGSAGGHFSTRFMQNRCVAPPPPLRGPHTQLFHSFLFFHSFIRSELE